jgi:predicted nucleic acid-binding protein
VLVVDASFLMAVFVEEEHTDFARSILAKLAETPRIAPGLVTWEFANILWKKRRKDEILEQHLSEAGDFLAVLDIDAMNPLEVEGVGDLADLARTHGLTAYDAAYFNLAMTRAAALATIDRNLTKAGLAAGLVVHSPFT